MKIGDRFIMKKLFYALFILNLFISNFSFAVEATLEVNPSATEMTEDENLSIEFKASVNEYNGKISSPHYDAPDFDEINSIGTMSGVESSFINGSISVKRTQSTTIVLHPKKAGKLKISNIYVTINDEKVKGPDITIDVFPSGSPRQNKSPYPTQGLRSQLPSGGAKPSQNNTSFFIKTEPSKLKVYKGEQIILTYAIYTQVPILGVQVERYPTVPGFLKEDMDIFILNQQFRFSRSVVGGKEYNRAPLAQYAIFPLKDGHLSIDPLVGKFSYRAQSPRPGMMDDDDANSIINQFFNTIQTSTVSKSSDTVSIEVMPLPAAGQPKNFTGLVGDFEITTAVDKYSLKAGEPLNVKVKVEGRGHAGSLESLNIEWPTDFEVYEDKSSTQFHRTGRSERIFDIMLVPKTKGKYQIPAIELSMFNPDTKSYVIRKSQPISIDVMEGVPGQVYVANKSKPASQPEQAPKVDFKGWMTVEDAQITEKSNFDFGFLAAIGSFIFLIFSVVGFNQKRTQKFGVAQKAIGKKEILEKAQNLLKLDTDPSEKLAEAQLIVSELLKVQFEIEIGSLVRLEVKSALEDKKVDTQIVNSIVNLLERCENFRFVPGGAQPQAAKVVVDELIAIINKL